MRELHIGIYQVISLLDPLRDGGNFLKREDLYA